MRFFVFLTLIVMMMGCAAKAEPTAEPPPPATRAARLPTVIITPSATATFTPSITPTYTPSQTPTITATFPTYTPTEIAPTPTFERSKDAEVAEGRGGLRMRRMPSSESTVLLNLREGVPLLVIGRSSDSQWVLVEIPEGFRGWVWASYLTLYVSLNFVEEIANPQPEPFFAVEPPADAASYSGVTTGITSTARQVYVKGQSLGNRRNVFSKVGDSVTTSPSFLSQLGLNGYNLQAYGYLLPALQFFGTEVARTSNSYANDSLAASGGWSTALVLAPSYANPLICQPGESPLECEYRVVKPSIALIMLGTNDVDSPLTAEQYRANLRRIVEISMARGVIPVLSTIPQHRGFESRVLEFNQIIISTAQAFDVPLWDYYSAMANLPNLGLSEDGVHPSHPAGAYSETTNFTPQNLQYGYTVRNLTALQILDRLWREVLY